MNKFCPYCSKKIKKKTYIIAEVSISNTDIVEKFAYCSEECLNYKIEDLQYNKIFYMTKSSVANVSKKSNNPDVYDVILNII